MPSILVSLPHRLPRPEVKRRVETLLTQLQQRYPGQISGLQQRWNGDSCSFSFGMTGSSGSGTVQISDTVVQVNLPLPWLFSLAAGRVRREIEEQGRWLLAG